MHASQLIAITRQSKKAGKSITKDGVTHNMHLFTQHLAGDASEKSLSGHDTEDNHIAEMAKRADINCDEEVIDTKE